MADQFRVSIDHLRDFAERLESAISTLIQATSPVQETLEIEEDRVSDDSNDGTGKVSFGDFIAEATGMSYYFGDFSYAHRLDGRQLDLMHKLATLLADINSGIREAKRAAGEIADNYEEADVRGQARFEARPTVASDNSDGGW